MLYYRKSFLLKFVVLVMFLVGMQGVAYSQVQGSKDSVRPDSAHAIKAIRKQQIANNINKQYDFGDLGRNLLHPHRKADTLKKRSGITIVPNIAANPTIGEQLGIKAVAGRKLGNDPNTFFSIYYQQRDHFLLYQP
jgi:hypothetical protein